MENVTKQWHKIMFAEDESLLGRPWQVTKQASQIHQASGLPREFAIFMELRDGARPVLYFSPIAAELCAELISSFEGAACSLPTDPMPSFTMAYGNAEEAWALVARDTPREERREAFDQHKSAQADTASKAQFIKIDPRDFIVSPFWHCPNCNQQEFGVLDIGRNRYTRRCRACWHTQYFDLPQITKKVIYLDQNAISNMMKALNPQTSAHQKGRVNPFWKTLFEKLDSLCKLQMIICPDSTAHSNESRVYTFFQALKRMYEQLSNGVSFYDPDTIRRFQVYEHLGNVLTGNPSAA